MSAIQSLDIRIADAARVEWSRIAKEEIKTEVVSGVIYAFGSELACLRIYQAFKGNGKVAFSHNLSTWYFEKA